MEADSKRWPPREGTDEDQVYPNTLWMPGTAVQVAPRVYQTSTPTLCDLKIYIVSPVVASPPPQRGSLALSDGDPLTPNWPSVEHAYRLHSCPKQFNTYHTLPTIP